MIRKLLSLFGKHRPSPAPSQQPTLSTPPDQAVEQAATAFHVGDKVLHPKFGRGVVEQTLGTDIEPIVQIRFDTDGVKMLALKYARLQLEEPANALHSARSGIKDVKDVDSSAPKTFAFKAIADIQEIAIESATMVVAFVQTNFGERLDYSDASVAIVERVLESAHAAYRNGQLKAEDVPKQAQLIGSYIGETYRRNHGAVWGLVTNDGAKQIGLQTKSGNKPAGLFWPLVRVENRIVNGGEDNVLHYYQFLVRQHGPADANC